jgi:hypothetical protein
MLDPSGEHLAGTLQDGRDRGVRLGEMVVTGDAEGISRIKAEVVALARVNQLIVVVQQRAVGCEGIDVGCQRIADDLAIVMVSSMTTTMWSYPGTATIVSVCR